MIFNFFLFNRAGDCLYFQEWKRLARSSNHSSDANAKLMFGMLFSIKNFCERISPRPSVTGFRHYSTGAYKLNYYETMSGLKFVMLTDNNVGDIQSELREIHSKFYIRYALKNPCYAIGAPITNEVFKEKLDEYVRSLPFFRV